MNPVPKDSSGPHLPRPAAVAACLAAAAVLLALFELLLHGRLVPLGIPREWAWARLPVEQVTSWAAYAGALVLLAMLAAWAAWGLTWVEGARPWQWHGGLAVTCLLVAGVQIEAEAMGPRGLFKWATALYLEQVSGQYTVASQVDSAGELVRHYDQFLRSQPRAHISTHPPGWFVVYRGVLTFYQGRPRAASWVSRQAPAEMTQAFDQIAFDQQRAIPQADRATIATVALASRAAAILVVLPAAWLVWLRSNRAAAWVAAAAAGLVPAGILFAPRSDTVYGSLAMLALALSLHAVLRPSKFSAAAAGGLLFAGLFMSLAFAAVAAWCALLAAWQWRNEIRLEAAGPANDKTSRAEAAWPTVRHLRKKLPLMAAAVAGLSAGPLLLYLFLGHNVLECWGLNLAKNAQFNELAGRTWWIWILANPIELAVAMGIPAAVMLPARVWAELRGLALHGGCDPLAASWLAMVLLLNLSGLNLGEVARLWLFLMPAGTALAAESVVVGARRPLAAGIFIFILLQGLACLVLARDLTVL